jgi:hypothetical protein
MSAGAKSMRRVRQSHRLLDHGRPQRPLRSPARPRRFQGRRHNWSTQERGRVGPKVVARRLIRHLTLSALDNLDLEFWTSHSVTGLEVWELRLPNGQRIIPPRRRAQRVRDRQLFATGAGGAGWAHHPDSGPTTVRHRSGDRPPQVACRRRGWPHNHAICTQ